MLSIEWQKIKRILAIRLDNIGDVVMLSPALRTLRQSLPNSSITLMASPAGSQVIPLLPWVDEVIVERVIWQDASGKMILDPVRELELIKTLSDRQFDAAIIFTSFSQSPYPAAYVCYLAGIPIRLGQSKEFGGSLLSQSVKPLPDYTHQVDRNLFLLESAGFPIQHRDLELKIPDQIQAKSDRLLRMLKIEPNEQFIVLAPGASCAARRYDIQRYATVAQILGVETGLPIVVVGSDCETENLKHILATTGRENKNLSFLVSHQKVVSLVGKTSVTELAGIIRRASLVIANDSGFMHIADAFRRPMVILYSGTELESQWQPRSAITKILRRRTDCSPCYKFQCPYQMECLDIPPEEVVSAAFEQLKFVKHKIIV